MTGICQLPIDLGGKIFLVNVMVMEGPLDFNMLHGHDYIYQECRGVYDLSRDAFYHNRSIVTIDQLTFDDTHPRSMKDHIAPLYLFLVFRWTLPCNG